MQAYELFERLRKASTYRALESPHVCTNSRSGFTSAGECRALNGLARAIGRVADQSCQMLSPGGMIASAEEKSRMLMEPLCSFFENIGEGEMGHPDD